MLRKKLTVKRKIDGAYVNGRWVETAANDLTDLFIWSTVQPTSPEDMKLLPDGKRQSQSYTLYPRQLLKTAGTFNPDMVIIYGDYYEVFSCEPWRNNIINHYKAIVIRVDEAVRGMSYEPIRLAAENILQFEVIYEHENGTRKPAKPYATILALTDSVQPNVSVLPVNNVGISDIVTHDAITVSFSIYTQENDAINYARQLAMGFRKPSIQLTLAYDGFAYVKDLMGPMDISSSMIDVQDKMRPTYCAKVDFEFRAARVETDDLGLVEKIKLQGLVNNNVVIDTTLIK